LNVAHVVLDEAHHAPAEQVAAVIAQFPARYLLGLSATPYRRDGLDAVIGFHVGPVVARIDKADLADRLIAPRIIKRDTGLRPAGDSFTELVSELVVWPERNALIVDDVAQAVACGRRCLVLSERVGHVKEVTRLLQKRGIAAAALYGTLGKRKRGEVVEALGAGELRAVVATVSLISEGFEVPLGPADVPESRSFRTVGGIASPPLFKDWVRQISRNHRGPHASPDGLSAITCQVSRTQRNLGEEVTQGRGLGVAHGLVEGDRGGQGRGEGVHAGAGDVQGGGKVGTGRRMAQGGVEGMGLAGEVGALLLHVLGDVGEGNLRSQGAADRLLDPPDGVGRELVAAGGVEQVDGAQEADRPLLHEVVEEEATVLVTGGDGADEATVGGDEGGDEGGAGTEGVLVEGPGGEVGEQAGAGIGGEGRG